MVQIGARVIVVKFRVRETIMVNTTQNPNPSNQTVENGCCPEQ